MSHEFVAEAGKPEGWLDRKVWSSWVILLLLPILLQMPFLLTGMSTDPIWFTSGVTQSLHSPLPSQPFLDPNVGFTTEALGRLAAWDWVHGVVPWWNPYTGVGMPLAGELQPGAFFLPFNLLLLLPEGMLLLRLLMQIISGLTTYLLFRELGMSRLAALTGGLLCQLNGTMAWMPGPSAVAYALPFFPLMLWGIERARKVGQGAVSILAIAISIAWSLLAGFPEPAYICGLLALVWGLYRLWSEPKRGIMLKRTLAGFGLGLCVAAPLLVSFVDYIGQSDSVKNHSFTGYSFPWAGWSAIAMPLIYGPAGWNFDSKTMTDLWGNLGGYTGLPVLLLAATALLSRSGERGLRYLLGGWVLVCWGRTFGIQPFAFLVNHVPMLGRAAFYRYAFSSWIFALIVLCCYGLDDLREKGADWYQKRRVAFAAVGIALVLSVGMAWPGRAYWQWSKSHELVMFAVLALALGWSALCLGASWVAWGRSARVTLALVLVIDAALVFGMVQATGVRQGRVDMAAVAFLQQHQGLGRNYTLGPLGPNYGAYFGVASLNHNVLPGPKLWEDYIDANLLPGLLEGSRGMIFDSSWDGFPKGEGRSALTKFLANYREMGVRYVITSPASGPGSDGSVAAPKHVKVQRVLKWAHGVLDDPGKPGLERAVARKAIGVLERPEETGHTQVEVPVAVKTPDAIDGFKRVYGDDLMNIYEVPDAAPYFQVIEGGPCVLTANVRETVTAKCETAARILRREMFMPGWRAVRDGTKVEVGQSGIFEAVSVPLGKSVVGFKFVPPYEGLGWGLCLLGVVGLLWQVTRLLLRRSDRTSNSASGPAAARG